MSALGGGPHLVHDLLGAGLLLDALWLAPLVAMWRPARRPGALLLHLAVVIAAVAAVAVSASNVVVLVVLLVQAALLVGLHPYRHEAWRSFATDRVLLSLAAVQAVPLVVYAVAQGRLQSNGDAHAALAHYFDQAWLAFLIVVLGLLSAVRADLRRLAGQLAGFAVSVIGLVGIGWPDLASSPGRGWGAAAVLAGLATVITARRATGTS